MRLFVFEGTAAEIQAVVDNMQPITTAETMSTEEPEGVSPPNEAAQGGICGCGVEVCLCGLCETHFGASAAFRSAQGHAQGAQRGAPRMGIEP